MKIFFMICWRNLWRHRRRSVIVISSVAIGIGAMLLSMGILNGVSRQAVDNNINIALGHLSIQKKGLRDSMSLKNGFVPDAGMVRAVNARRDRVRGWTRRLKAQGMLNSSESSAGVVVVGVEPGREEGVSSIASYIVSPGGGSFLAESDPNGICISRASAEKLDVTPGDTIVVMLQDGTGDMSGAGMTVRGIFQTPVDAVDQYVAFVGLKRLQEMTGAGDSVSEINIVLRNREDADEIGRGLRKEIAMPGIAVLTWKEMAPYLVSSILVLDVMMYVSFGIIFITVVFSIANTLIMAIMERFHEIGVMKAIGTKPSWIFSMIMFESINLGLVGLVAGVAASAVILGVLSKAGINFSFQSDTFRTLGSGSVIYPAMRLKDVFAASAIVIVTTIAAAVYPARKGAKIGPLEAITFI